MPRIRTIKPSFWSDPDLATVSHEARLLMAGLISMADDEARFIATHQTIVGYVFPWEQISKAALSKWLSELTAERPDRDDPRPVVELYSDGGRPYGWFPRWLKHQKINRPQPSVLPPPPSLNGSRKRQ